VHEGRQDHQAHQVVGSGRQLIVQGVVKSYDPISSGGTVISDTTLSEYELAPGALAGSSFRMLRQGQRVVWDLDDSGFASRIRLGSEVDMATPGFPSVHDTEQ
jgi:hypothetical protein